MSKKIFNSTFRIILAVLYLLSTGLLDVLNPSATSFAQVSSQPPGIVLDSNGTSTIAWVFETREGWGEVDGSSRHKGDDVHARDWNKGAGDEDLGENLYAGISGKAYLRFKEERPDACYGNTLVIFDSRTGFALRYAHLAEFSTSLTDGSDVKVGQYIGKLGDSQGATSYNFPDGTIHCGDISPHLHLALYTGASSPDADPIFTSSQTHETHAAAFHLLSSILSPSELISAAVQNSSVSLNWEDNSAEEDGFIIERKDGDTFIFLSQVGRNQASYTDTSIASPGVYCYRVKAYSGPGESFLSSTSNESCTTIALNTPTGLTASMGNAQISLSWNPVSGASGYNIKRSANSGGPYSVLTTGITTTTYLDRNLTNGVTYYYVVSALGSPGESPNSSELSATPQVAALDAPTGLTANIGNTQVRLTWNALSNASGYNIKRSTSSGGPYSVIANGVTVTTYLDRNLTNGTTYYYVVSALGPSGESPNSSGVSATPQSTTSNTFIVTAEPGDKLVNLDWDHVDAAYQYEIRRSTNSGQYPANPTATIPTSSYQDKGLTNGTTYYYKVSAINSNGGVITSAETSATPDATGKFPKPSNLQGNVVYTPDFSTFKVHLSWIDNSFCGSYCDRYYDMQRKEKESGDWITFDAGTQVPGNNNLYEYTDSYSKNNRLSPGKTYLYRVRRDAGDTSSDWSDPPIEITMPSCTYAISPQGVTIGGMGGTGSIQILIPHHCPWNSESNDKGWLHLTRDGLVVRNVGSEEGDGYTTLSYSVDVSCNPRSGTISIANQTFTISQAARQCMPQPTGGAYWGWDIGRSIIMLPDETGGYVLDGWGGIHAWKLGNNPMPPTVDKHPYWGSVVRSQGLDIARSMVILPNGVSGYMLNGYGEIYPWAAVGYDLPPNVDKFTKFTRLMRGQQEKWDIARSIVILPDGTGGYVLDGWGRIYPWATVGHSLPPAADKFTYWDWGWDIARSMVMLPDGSGGYVLDGWGGVHPWATVSHNLPPSVANDTHYWGWDIARSIVMLPSGAGGYILDGWGAVHPWAAAGHNLPPNAETHIKEDGAHAYWEGWDIVRSLVVLNNGTGGYILNGYGDIYAYSTSPEIGAAPNPGFTAQIHPGETIKLSVEVPPGHPTATFTTTWPGSDVVMSLLSPSGRVIDRNTVASDVKHTVGPVSESYAVLAAEPGNWEVSLYGAEVAPEGEEVVFNFATESETPRPALASVEDGVLVLNLGSEERRKARNLQPDEVNEEFVIRQLEANTFAVTAFGLTQTYTNVTRVQAAGDDGNDIITLEAGNVAFTAPAEITGGSGDDQIQGGDGADTLSGGSDADRINGSGGDDTINGDEGDDDLAGGGGNDTITGGAGADVLHSGDGNDKLSGGAGSDKLYGDAGNDTIEGNADNDYLEGNDGTDILRGGDGDDELYGQADADEIEGNAGQDKMYGGAGDDRMDGGTDNDYLEGNDGADVMRGDDGDDELSGQAGADEMYGDNGKDTLYGNTGEDVIRGSTGDDYMEGNEDADTLYGDDGKDILHGGAGNDYLEGNDGADVMHGDGEDDKMRGNAGVDEMYGDDGNDMLYGNTENDTMYGGAGDDYMEGNQDTDTMHGDGGQDDMIGGTPVAGTLDGQDIMYGGSDHDVLIGDNGRITRPGGVNAYNGSVKRDVVLYDVQVVGGPVVNSDVSGDDLMSGDEGDDVMLGQGGNDTMFGGIGNDYMEGNAGTDIMNGEAGQDDMIGGSGDDQIQGGDGTDTLSGGSGNDQINGGSGDDTISGDEGDDDLNGGAGNDTITGGTGADVLHGGDGDDNLSGGADSDKLYGDAGNDIIEGGADKDYLEGNDGADIMRGGDGYDELHGQADADEMYGDAGQDKMYGGDGDDRMDGGADADYLEGNDGADTMHGGSADDKMYGNAGADEMYGDDGKDTLYGNTGNDVMHGGAGEDYMEGNEDADTMYGDDSRDTMYGNAGNDMMHGGTADDYMEGNEDADTMYGDDGQDDLIGGTPAAGTSDGQDTLYGGPNQDVIVGDNGRITRPGGVNAYNNSVQRDVVLYDVQVVGGPTISTNVSGDDHIFGDDGDDLLFGQGGNDTMSGGSGDDYLEGNAGADKMNGDAGQDDMIGGGSANDGVIDADRRGDGLLDMGDQIHGDVSGDVMAGDNARITRPVDSNGHWLIDPNTGEPIRQIVLFDVEAVSGSAINPATSGSDQMFGDDGHDLIFGQGNSSTSDAIGMDPPDGVDNDRNGRENGSPASVFDCLDGRDNDGDGRVDKADPQCAAAIDNNPGGDEMHGGAGDDYMEGNHGSDWMFGDDGEDDMLGGSSAGNGLIGGSVMPTGLRDGSDVMSGNDEDDVLIGDNGQIVRPTDANGLNKHLTSGAFDLAIRGVRMAQTPEPAGAYGNDWISGGNDVDDIYGQLGNDWMLGDTGEDAMVGDLGKIINNLIGVNDGIPDPGTQQFIAPNAPFFDPGELIYKNGSLYRQVELYTFVSGGGGAGNDTMYGGGDDDALHGGSGDDIMNGNAGDDHLFGGDDSDAIWGGPGHDIMFGGYGLDYLDVLPRSARVDKKDSFPEDPPTWFEAAQIDNYQGLDIMSGGWDRDWMEADVSAPGRVNGDRMIDWAGGFNAYYRCDAAYGDWVITRQHSPNLVAFLQALAQGHGAVNTVTAGTSGFRETAIVFSQEIKDNANLPNPDNPAHFTCGPAR